MSYIHNFKEICKIIKESVSIVDVAYMLNLCIDNNRGGNPKTNCTNHRHGDGVDANPSMFLYRNSNRYHCFSCRNSGSVIDLVMQCRSIDKYEAVDWLCENFGIKKPERLQKQYVPQDDVKYYSSFLRKLELPESCRNYLKSRGLNEETIEKFQIKGIDDYSSAQQCFVQEYGFEVWEKTGLSRLYVWGSKNVPQVIFPIFKNYQVVGYVVRPVIDTKSSKYIRIGDKSTFFNQDALDTLSKGDEVYIVEGPFDCCSLEQCGCKSIAMLGNELKHMNLDVLKASKEKTIHFILSPDKDVAGTDTELGLLEVFDGIGIKPQLIYPESGNDWNEELVNRGRIEINSILNHGENRMEDVIRVRN
ncbi:MAG: CHC2 zinc finger domain-containing protein [Candidatus Theseobacter exili]|nr:CHC2 zinc finger domain-containing protein [Candidatus Theseobacter exili]